MRKISKKIIAMALTGAIAVGGMGITGVAMAPEAVQTASATQQNVGGGILTYKKISGVYIEASYYHPTKKHSVTVSVGNGKLAKDVKPAGQTAKASACGIGTTHVWWNTY